MIQEDPAFLREQLITCIGNKRALLAPIAEAVERVRGRLQGRRLRILDLFSGSGVVARLLKQHAKLLVANDLECYSEVLNRCFLGNAADLPRRRLNEALAHVRAALARPEPGFICELYAPEDDARIRPGERVFYSRENALTLDTARRAVDDLDEDLRPLVLGPLLAEASVHANTAGVFKGFYKGKDGLGRFGGRGGHALTRILGRIEIRLPVLSRFSRPCEVYRSDAGELLKQPALRQAFDLAYLDPPYNQHPYGSNYFMLNLLAEGRKPEAVSKISGIPADWNRSPFNKKDAARDALFRLIMDLPTRFVLISYNSEGFIRHEELLDFLAGRGRVELVAIPYNAFRGSRNLSGRPLHVTEFLYLLENNHAQRRRRSIESQVQKR